MRRGADANIKNKAGDTLLHAEIRRMRPKTISVVKLLAGSRADMNILNGDVSPLTMALCYPLKQLDRLDSNECAQNGQHLWITICDLLIKNGARWKQASKVDDNGRTLLHLLFIGLLVPSSSFAGAIVIGGGSIGGKAIRFK